MFPAGDSRYTTSYHTLALKTGATTIRAIATGDASAAEAMREIVFTAPFPREVVLFRIGQPIAIEIGAVPDDVVFFLAAGLGAAEGRQQAEKAPAPQFLLEFARPAINRCSPNVIGLVGPFHHIRRENVLYFFR